LITIWVDSRKSAREVGASRLFCFTAGFSGSPNAVRFQAGWQRLLPVHNLTVSEPTLGAWREVHILHGEGL
jgi:hypothetical protein